MKIHPRPAALALLAVGSAAFARGSSHSGESATVSRDPVITSLQQQVSAQPEKACLRNELGIALARRAHFKEAAEAFRASLEISEDPVVYNNLGSLYLTLDKPSEATSAFKRAIALDPNFALAWYNLGASYGAEHDFDGAVENFKRALELDPSLGDPTINPQVINNTYMTAVKTERYLESVGALGLPLKSTCGQAEAVAGSAPGAPKSEAGAPTR